MITRALSDDEYKSIIEVCKTGFVHKGKRIRPNERIASALILQYNLGLRINDLLSLRLDDVKKEGDRYILDIIEQKTKRRKITRIPITVYSFMLEWSIKNNISPSSRLFQITARTVQRHLKMVSEFLGYRNISTHSMRKSFGTNIYYANGKDIMLVKMALNHASAANSQKYICVSPEQLDRAIENNVNLLS